MARWLWPCPSQPWEPGARTLARLLLLESALQERGPLDTIVRRNRATSIINEQGGAKSAR